MRCYVENCHYNEDNFCRQPDYVSIDRNGECSQMEMRPVKVEKADEGEED